MGPREAGGTSRAIRGYLVQIQAMMAVATEPNENEVQVDWNGEVRLATETVEHCQIARLYPMLRQASPSSSGLLQFFLFHKTNQFKIDE